MGGVARNAGHDLRPSLGRRPDRDQLELRTGPGAGTYSHEDPFAPVVDEKARITREDIKNYTYGEDVAFWGHGDVPLIVETDEGRKVFTGISHMPILVQMP